MNEIDFAKLMKQLCDTEQARYYCGGCDERKYKGEEVCKSCNIYEKIMAKPVDLKKMSKEQAFKLEAQLNDFLLSVETSGNIAKSLINEIEALIQEEGDCCLHCRIVRKPSLEKCDTCSLG